VTAAAANNATAAVFGTANSIGKGVSETAYGVLSPQFSAPTLNFFGPSKRVQDYPRCPIMTALSPSSLVYLHVALLSVKGVRFSGRYCSPIFIVVRLAGQEGMDAVEQKTSPRHPPRPTMPSTSGSPPHWPPLVIDEVMVLGPVINARAVLEVKIYEASLLGKNNFVCEFFLQLSDGTPLLSPPIDPSSNSKIVTGEHNNIDDNEGQVPKELKNGNGKDEQNKQKEGEKVEETPPTKNIIGYRDFVASWCECYGEYNSPADTGGLIELGLKLE
jgi:hypothetical protein